MCIICGEGKEIEILDVYKRPEQNYNMLLAFTVCTSCRSEFALPEQSRYNVKVGEQLRMQSTLELVDINLGR